METGSQNQGPQLARYACRAGQASAAQAGREVFDKHLGKVPTL